MGAVHMHTRSGGPTVAQAAPIATAIAICTGIGSAMRVAKRAEAIAIATPSTVPEMRNRIARRVFRLAFPRGRRAPKSAARRVAYRAAARRVGDALAPPISALVVSREGQSKTRRAILFRISGTVLGGPIAIAVGALATRIACRSR